MLVEHVLSRLTGVRKSGHRWKALCPAHDDRNPSLSIWRDDDGEVCVKCFAGCATSEILKALGLAQPDPSRKLASSKSGPVVAVYPYRDEQGQVLFEVVRYAPKQFRQRRPDGKGGHIWDLQGVRRVLYRLRELAAAPLDQTAFIVEGEKDADRLAAAGLIATTCPGGAGKWRHIDAGVLRDRRIVILPDNDQPGRQHAQEIGTALHGHAAEVRVVELPDLPEKGDVSDWLADGHSIEALHELVERTPPWTPSLSAGPVRRIEQYESGPEGLACYKDTRDGEVRVPLTNFDARIVGESVRDDGVEQSRVFEIEATLRGRTSRFTVPVAQFGGMSWVLRYLGAGAVVHAGLAAADRTRVAIQVLSEHIEQRVVFTHLGWRLVGSQFVYLHAGGALGPEGPAADVAVDLEPQISAYRLPAPPPRNVLRERIRDELSWLHVAPPEVAYPLFCTIWRAILGNCDFAIHIVGQTGAGKSELAALVQQHFGPALDARHLPGAWSSTPNALEALAFLAKDAVLVVDDLAPDGSARDVQRLRAGASRVIRAQGNLAGRARLRPDGTQQAVRPPRGLILSTGEDVPTGHSIRARLLVLELELPVDWRLLTVCQHDAAAGRYADLVAGFIRWLAGQYERRLTDARARVAALRNQERFPGRVHQRTATIIAELRVGLELFGDFARDLALLAPQDLERLQQECTAALQRAADRQGDHQRSADPVNLFIELLQSALVSGSAHLTGRDGTPPDEPLKWGWCPRAGSVQQFDAQGTRIGWLVDNDVYIDFGAAYHLIERQVAASAESLGMTQTTLGKRLHQRGLLASRDEKRGRNTIRRMLDGARREVLHFRAGTLMPAEASQPAHPPLDQGPDQSEGDSGDPAWDGDA
jgi:hypothetical protein